MWPTGPIKKVWDVEDEDLLRAAKHRLQQLAAHSVEGLTVTVESVFENPASDVVGLVDELLRLCQEQALELDWQDGHCRIHLRAERSDTVVERPLRKSVFRAMLARLAVLCNQQHRDSVSAYGGQGQLAVGSARSNLLGVEFANTADEQWVRLRPVGPVTD